MMLDIHSYHTLHLDFVLYQTLAFFSFLIKFNFILFLLAVLQISRFMSVNKLKYFFAVDSKYVIKKLMILMFPYTHQVTRGIVAFSGRIVITHTCIVVTVMSFSASV